MSGAFVTSELTGLNRVLDSLNAVASPRLQAQGLANIGGLIESQTRNRFSERRAPDGTPWTPWSEAYRKTRTRGQSLLVASGAFRDSIAWDLTGDELRVGSNLVQAALHQEGGTDDMAPGPAAVPARPWLGVSDDNVAEIEQAMADWIGEVMQ